MTVREQYEQEQEAEHGNSAGQNPTKIREQEPEEPNGP